MPFVARFISALLAGSILFAAIGQEKAWAAPAPEAASRSEVQVDLFRGLADIFSRGMDTLTHRLNQEGYSARVYSTNQWPTAAQRVADEYSRGRKVIVVLVGHSLGGNAIFDAAYELDKRNVPIELLVSFDATNPRAAQRYSIVTFLPSTYPVSERPRRNASARCANFVDDPLLRNPTTGDTTCCARAVSGHATTVLLKSLMNSRRLMGFAPLAENHLRLKSNTNVEQEPCTPRSSKTCPLYPRKQTLSGETWISALCQKRTSRLLFDHFVGAG
jgi:pimeloyl-ACP methyl ester carboxylesterase